MNAGILSLIFLAALVFVMPATLSATVSTPFVWVANFDSQSVTKINGTDGATIGTYATGASPYGVAADANGNIWTANSGSGTVTKINATDGSTTGTYTTGSGPVGVAADTNGNSCRCDPASLHIRQFHCRLRHEKCA